MSTQLLEMKILHVLNKPLTFVTVGHKTTPRNITIFLWLSDQCRTKLRTARKKQHNIKRQQNLALNDYLIQIAKLRQ